MVNRESAVGDVVNLRVDFSKEELSDFLRMLVSYGMSMMFSENDRGDLKMLTISACDGVGEYRMPLSFDGSRVRIEMGRFSLYHADLLDCVEESLVLFGGTGTVYTYGYDKVTCVVYESGESVSSTESVVSEGLSGLDLRDLTMDVSVYREVVRMEMDASLSELYELMESGSDVTEVMNRLAGMRDLYVSCVLK